MNRKIISLAAILFAVASLARPMQAAQGQGGAVQVQPGNNCNCNNQSSYCCKLWRCMYGQMASDGTGGSLRVYGYPRPHCCGSPCYPVWGTGGTCPPGYNHDKTNHW